MESFSSARSIRHANLAKRLMMRCLREQDADPFGADDSLRCESWLHPHGAFNIHGRRGPAPPRKRSDRGTVLTLLLLPVFYEWILEQERPTNLEQDGDGVGELPATAQEANFGAS